MNESLSMIVNGKQRTVTTDPARPLLEVLREEFRLTGAKYGCGEGSCRACTVLLDGKPVASCMTRVSEAKDKRIVTIEGLSNGDALHPVQQAFLAEGAMQCGYCVPGMILTAAALLKKNPNATERQIVEGMNGNLCRCCGFPSIVAAIHNAAKQTTARISP